MTAPQQQKLRIAGPVVITANRLGDGAVVYRTDAERWTTDLDAAAVTTNAQEAKARLVHALKDEGHAVGAYVAPVRVDSAGRLSPGNLREEIRWHGPTIKLPASHPVEVKPHVPL